MPEPTTPLVERPWEDVERMLDVDSALERVLSAFSPLQPVTLPLLDAADMVLAADVIAVNDVPPFRNSAMDGYAVRAADTLSARWSSPAELPQNLEFLFSRNRLNVAISRARCVAAVVASPALLDTDCRTIEQMRLVNALCRTSEVAQ